MSDPVSNLQTAYERLESVEQQVDDVGEARVEAVADAHRKATRLLDRYADSATGSGDFQSYLQFQNEFIGLVDELPEDLPHREAFEAASDRMDKRRLNEGDFAFARETLEPAAETASLLSKREEARDDYHVARRAAHRRKTELDERLDELDRLQRLGEVDLDAPVELLRDPIESYNESVNAAFQRFRREASARDFLDFVAVTDRYPFVEFETPPSDLREYVDSHAAGEESVTQLLEYADYSASKLAHYVDDASALQTNVAVHRTYLERVDADPLTVAWPPESAGVLRHRSEELVTVVGRFADEETVALAREIRDLTERDDYERLRTAAAAQSELTDDERERVTSGVVADERAEAEAERERLAEVLSSTPSR
ncbi:DUF7118 family protein [Halogranum rubrum]|uniref:Uncharacterized protein n=1 Tax=Halogranum salarium B-1 TaxID=1210908 RepID=J2ZH53_9EURY|nr:hypothetical protein [Halogranum salarium]EJN60030.1 hypothetical protein HSB1_21880 [Halogranum salarium B-1]